MGSKEMIRDLVEPFVANAGLQLWDVELGPGLIRVLVDRPGGVDLDALDAVAPTISAALDAHDELVPRGRYDLEVGSPGAERTLRTPSQFRQFVGTLVAIKTSQPIDGSRRFQGILTEADDGGVAVDGAPFTYEQIEKAHTVLVWGPKPKPGRRTRPSTATAPSTEARTSVAAGPAGATTATPATTMKDAVR